MKSSLVKFSQYIKKQIDTIQQPPIDLMDKVILTRSCVENYAIYNFLLESHTDQRIQLFLCFGDFEWYSHQIYYSSTQQDRVQKFYNFLIQIKKQYPYGYLRYGRLIKRRACKRLRQLIHKDSKSAKKWQSKLDRLNSDQSKDEGAQRTLLAEYMSHHLITKLPFPYRIIFGKSITYFVLKYSQIHKSTYWLLADLSHGTLMENHLNDVHLDRLIQNVLGIIKSHLKA